MTKPYYKTKESVEEYIQMAKEVNSAQLIQQLKPILPNQSKLLEIGSGPGTDWRLLNAYYNVVGSDFSDVFIQHLRKQNPEGAFLKLDAITLETTQTFDGIYSNKVLHHLTDNDLERSIENQLRRLNPNGLICHSFWNGKGNEMFKGMFVNYHNKEDLKLWFQPYFDILTVKEYKEFEDGDSVVLIARKK